jgi:prepilin-type N-terminal cleavage/methylation domain-containing protein
MQGSSARPGGGHRGFAPGPAGCRHGERGYSLIELMVVVCLVGLLSGMAVMQIGAVRPGMVSDGAMRSLIGALNSARETAVTQRREVQVTFVGVNQFVVTRRDIPAGTTLLTSVGLEGGVQFLLVAGAGDTPDGFGAITATPATMIVFGSDGMMIDTTGAPINGTIFLSIPGTPESLRAVTVLGATGRVRGYRWAGGTDWMRG